jgi:hypothetical protein
MKAYPATVTFTTGSEIPDSQEPVKIAFLGKANIDGDGPAILCREDLRCRPLGGLRRRQEGLEVWPRADLPAKV